MSQDPNDMSFMNLLNSSSSNPSTPSSQSSSTSSQVGFQAFQYPRQSPPQFYQSQPQFYPSQPSQPQFYPSQPSQTQFYPSQAPPTQFYPSQQHYFESQFKVPQPPPTETREELRQGKKPAKATKKKKKAVVNLDADDEEEDVDEEGRTTIRWSNNEEKILAECWVEVSQNAAIGNDRLNDAFWTQIWEDFRARSPEPYRTKNMCTGKWTRINGDCQKFNGFYKHLQRRSGENDVDHIENARLAYKNRTGKNFNMVSAWKVLREYPKWDAPDGINEDNIAELFGHDPRARPAGKPRLAKKSRSVESSTSTGGSQSDAIAEALAQEYKRKVDGAREVYEAKIEKEKSEQECRELEFLMHDIENLPEPKRTILKKKQDELIAKYYK